VDNAVVIADVVIAGDCDASTDGLYQHYSTMFAAADNGDIGNQGNDGNCPSGCKDQAPTTTSAQDNNNESTTKRHHRSTPLALTPPDNDDAHLDEEDVVDINIDADMEDWMSYLLK